MLLIPKNTRNIFISVLRTKLYVLVIDLSSQLFFTEEIMQSVNLLKQFLKKINTAKKIIKKHFNKNLVISVENEKSFKSSNKCWIYNKLFAAGDK